MCLPPPHPRTPTYKKTQMRGGWFGFFWLDHAKVFPLFYTPKLTKIFFFFFPPPPHFLLVRTPPTPNPRICWFFIFFFLTGLAHPKFQPLAPPFVAPRVCLWGVFVLKCSAQIRKQKKKTFSFFFFFCCFFVCFPPCGARLWGLFFLGLSLT